MVYIETKHVNLRAITNCGFISEVTFFFISLLEKLCSGVSAFRTAKIVEMIPVKYEEAGTYWLMSKYDEGHLSL